MQPTLISHAKPFVAVALCVMATHCLAEATPAPAPAKTNLTTVAIMHTVECPNPKREVCVIKKPVGSGYRILTQGISLEDAGEYWLADFTRPAKGKAAEIVKTSFRVMGKDSDIHEIEISFPGEAAAQSKPTVKPPAPAKKAKKKAKAD